MLETGQVFLIGKKRSPARITSLTLQDVVPDYEQQGISLPIQVAPTRVMSFRAFAPLVGTQRYFILKILLSSDIPRFSIGGYVVPLVQA
jgi:hypothetical protein